jgi:phage terminase large subunit
VLRGKPYVYGEHWAPHDIQVRELSSGRSRMETAQKLGISFRVVPQERLEDGIHAARMLLPRCWFDATKTEAGREALGHYRWDYNTRINEFKPVPLHDWASHGADAFRGLALRHRLPKWVDPERAALDALRKSQRDHDPDDHRFGQIRRGGY